ncbi:hypothetical protein ABIF66_001809 [Bradyrhizobium japonicum]
MVYSFMKRCSSPARMFILLLCVFCLCSPSLADPLGDRGWQTFPRRVKVLNDSFQGNFEREVIKTDYFICQKKVVIDNLISTNGGNVLIAADELVINAPIDTRVYMRMTPDYWAAAPAGQDGVHVASLFFSMQQGLPLDGLKSFDSLYLWRDSYDPEKKMFIYGEVPRPKHRPPPLGTLVAEVPQLPSGQVPLASDQMYGNNYTDLRPTDGSDAPVADVIWPEVRSGTIRIYASKISLCDECKKKLSEHVFEHPIGYVGTPSKPVGDPLDVNQAVFLQASGLKGGRGAAGSSYYFLGRALSGMQGGLSGSPGRGGDAGSIEIHYVNHEPTVEEENLIRLATSVVGGVPAQLHRKRTPAFDQLIAVPNRNAFRDEVPVANLDQLVGTAGKILIDSVDTDTAIRGVHEKLVEGEIAGNFSVELLVLGAKKSPDLFSISPVATLQPLLAQELVRLQSDLLRSVAHKFLSSPEISPQFSPFFASLTCNRNAYALLPDGQQDYLAKLCEFRAVAERDSFTSYLFRVGGIYRDIPEVNLSLRHGQIAQEINRTQQLVYEAINEIKDLRLLVYSAISEEQRRELVAAIEKLQAARRSLQDAYEAALNKQPGMADAVKKITQVGNDFAEGIAAYYSSNWAVAAIKCDSGMRGLGDLLVAYRFPPTSPNFAQLDVAINEVQQNLKAFVVLVHTTKSAIIKSKGINLRDLILTRDRLEDYRTASRFDFDKLVRVAVQEYLQTSDATVLRKNLDVISSTVNETNFSSVLELPSIRRLCQGDPNPTPFSQLTGKAGCVEWDRQNSYVIISKRSLSELPLLVISKANGTITRSFEQAFQASEIERLSLTFEEITDSHPIYWASDCSSDNKPSSWWIVIRGEDGRLTQSIQLPPEYWIPGSTSATRLTRLADGTIASKHSPWIHAISSMGYMYAVSSDGKPAIHGQSDNFDDQMFRVREQHVMFRKFELERSVVNGEDAWTFNLACH